MGGRGGRGGYVWVRGRRYGNAHCSLCLMKTGVRRGSQRGKSGTDTQRRWKAGFVGGMSVLAHLIPLSARARPLESSEGAQSSLSCAYLPTAYASLDFTRCTSIALVLSFAIPTSRCDDQLRNRPSLLPEAFSCPRRLVLFATGNFRERRNERQPSAHVHSRLSESTVTSLCVESASAHPPPSRCISCRKTTPSDSFSFLFIVHM